MTLMHPRACHVLIAQIPAWGRKIQGTTIPTASYVRHECLWATYQVRWSSKDTL